MRKPEAVPSSRMTATFVGRDMKEIRILLLLNSFQGARLARLSAIVCSEASFAEVFESKLCLALNLKSCAKTLKFPLQSACV